MPDISATEVVRAPKWSDEKSFELLKLYVQFAQFPFYNGLLNNQRRKQSAEETVQLLLAKKTIEVGGEEVPLRELTSPATVWDRLKGKAGSGFSFAKDKPILLYVDEEMAGNVFTFMLKIPNHCTSHGNDSIPPMWLKDSHSLYKSW